MLYAYPYCLISCKYDTSEDSILIKLIQYIFLIFFIVDLYKKLFKDYTKKEKNNNDDDPRFDELLSVQDVGDIVAK